MIERSIDRYSSLLEREQFFEAHELLEELWIDIKSKDREFANLLKGYINAATTFVLFQKGRSSYVKTWATYRKYLPLKNNLDSEQLLDSLDKADDILKKKVEKFQLDLKK